MCSEWERTVKEWLVPHLGYLSGRTDEDHKKFQWNIKSSDKMLSRYLPVAGYMYIVMLWHPVLLLSCDI
jgi:hypothetical protein